MTPSTPKLGISDPFRGSQIDALMQESEAGGAQVAEDVSNALAAVVTQPKKKLTAAEVLAKAKADGSVLSLAALLPQFRAL